MCKELYHKCSNVKCCANFSGECQQPFLHCENNIRIAFEALKTQKQLEKFKEYFENLYGEGYEVANWHLNGELEPLDNFIDSAIDYMEGRIIWKTMLDKDG